MPSLLDTDQQFENIKGSLTDALQKALTMEGKRHRLVVKKVEIDDNLDPDDLKSQLTAKLEQRTWGVPVYADIELQDRASGEKLDRARLKILDIPKLTPRYSFIVNGSEFQVSNQLRLRPGAYVRKRKTGETQAFVNLERGGHIRMNMAPESGKITAKIRGANVNVYSLMKILGIHDKEIQDQLGEGVHSTIVSPNVDADIVKLHQTLFHSKPADPDKGAEALRDFFKQTKISPETTLATLGKSYESIDGDFVVKTVKKLIAVNKGEAEPDDRDEVRYKKLMTPDDLLEQRISKNVKLIQARIKPKLDQAQEVRSVIQPRQIAKLIYASRGEDSAGSFYNSSTLSNNPDQTNPVDFLSGFTKVTYLGEGGITDTHAVTLPSRNINASQVGFLDPIASPENAEVGIVNHLPLGASKVGGELRTRVIGRDGKEHHLSANEAFGAVIAFPKEVDSRWRPIGDDKVTVYKAGKVVEVDPSEVTHKFADPSDLYSVATNLIPFLSANQGARAMMGAKMMSQAVSLVDREAPLVQSRLAGAVTSDQAVGGEFSFRSPVDGTVLEASEGVIRIKDQKGDVHDVQYYENFPLNGDVGLNADLKVKKGDRVKAGQLIADTNFTKDGTLAIGKNLKVAYVPYKGYTFEDGIVLSEAAAQKLSSEHMHRVEAPRIRTGGVATVYDREKFQAYYPTHYTSDQLGKLDKEGVVRVGQKVSKGDPLILYLQEKALTPEDIAMGKLKKSLVRPFKNKELSWDLDDDGEVVRVAKTPEGPTVWVKTKEPIKIGDKLAGRHGNKGVVTMIVPDREMPRTDDGPVDIIMDPHGIPSRINVGQIYETVTGKIAKKTGKPYVVDNFTDESYMDRVKADLKKAGLSDQEMLTDPAGDDKLGKALVGYQYIMKLRYPVRAKFAGRSTDRYTHDMRPAKGGEFSAQSLDPLKMFSMLSHGAKENIREMSTYKAEANDEFWRALQLKQPLPAPKPTFAWDKFVAMMRSAGINVQKEGDIIRPLPITDDETLAMSSGAIQDAKYVRAKDLRPEKGGLFDPTVTGGVGGGRWAHIPLAEAMPNPVFEDSIRALTGLSEKDYEDVVSGKAKVDRSGKIVRGGA
jgi:DNA-directed RNA polymerase subunit beta